MLPSSTIISDLLFDNIKDQSIENDDFGTTPNSGLPIHSSKSNFG